MHRSFRAAITLLLFTLLVVGCQPAPASTPAIQYVVVTATAGPAAPAAEATLKVVGSGGEKTISLADLKALPAVEGWGGIKSSTGKITAPALFKGVAVQELAKLVGPFDASLAVNIVAKDGYAMTFSHEQVTQGGFIAFDPGTGDELQREEPLTLIVAYEREGQPIPEDSDGTLRLAIVTPKNDQVTDGHWAVKWVREVVVKPAAAEWTLHLEGALVEDMDRATFESGSAPNCHLAEWVDAEGHKWTGIPLYFLLGRVDDATRHEKGAFNAELAATGYQVDVVASDGYKASFDAKRLMGDKTILLANMMDGQPLPEAHFPLRLVGPGLPKNEMVSTVAQVVLHLDKVTAAAEPTKAPTVCETKMAEAGAAKPEMAAGVLHVYGAVGKDTAFDLARLKQMGLEKVMVEPPKKGQVEYEGVRLKAILAEVQPQAGAKKVVLTAGDGYASEADLTALSACADCLVAVDGTTLNLAMPGLDGSLWAKDIRLIEIK